MSCKHRFYNNLIPEIKDLKYIFVGTFNPSWNSEYDNADFFYGRSMNNFWCIMPHALGDQCLIDKTVIEWKEYCKNNKIGITDLIKEIKNVSEDNQSDKDKITKGFADKELESFELEFNTDDINSLISKNIHSLNGVFLTRKSESGIPTIWNEWLKIKAYCSENNIYSNELVTPSVYGPGNRKSIEEWREIINKKNCSLSIVK